MAKKKAKKKAVTCKVTFGCGEYYEFKMCKTASERDEPERSNYLSEEAFQIDLKRYKSPSAEDKMVRLYDLNNNWDMSLSRADWMRLTTFIQKELSK